MAANEDDQTPTIFEEFEAESEQKKQKVVAAEKTDKTKQSREKAKSRNSGFVAFLKKADPIALTCFVVILLASAVVIGSFVKSEYFDDESSGTATSGSKVEVDYVGYYFPGNDWTVKIPDYTEGGVIFDTSISGVGEDEDLIFSGAYTVKEEYNALSFTVGGGTVLKAFGDACAGHRVGDVVYVAIPASNITDSSDIRQSYGKVDRVENVANEMIVKMNGEMSLETFNRLCETSYTADSFPNGETVKSFIKDVDFVVSYDGEMVNYAFISVADNESAEMTVGTLIKISEASATSFKLSYRYTANAVVRGITTAGDTVTSAFIEHVSGADNISYYLDDFSDVSTDSSGSTGNPEAKGETMYFYIKIVSIS